jgi:hypothetical protein
MDSMTDYGISRDRWGRPYLYPPEGGEKVSYTRASTMKSWLDDKSGLVAWKATMAMVGMSQSKPLQARVSALAARGGDVYQDNKGQFRELVETATQLAQAQGRADYGTAIHEFTELADAGTLDWKYVPESLKGPIDAYQQAVQRLRVVDAEVFVAVDEEHGGEQIRSAGSLDRLFDHPDLGVVVGDLKTGAKEPLYPLGVTTQVAIYSRGKRYRDADFPGNPPFEDGQPNADNTAWRAPLYPHLNKTTGILVHCPLEKVKGEYICKLYALDLERGWDHALLGVRVQAARRAGKLDEL